MISKHEFPILEYDHHSEEVILPCHQPFKKPLPSRAVFAFLEDHIDAYAKEHNAQTVGFFQTVTMPFPIYVVNYRGEDICLCRAPLGSAASAQFLDYLIGHGCQRIITGGCCGALVDLPENAFLIPAKALRDEGASYHYLPPARYVEIAPEARRAIRETLDAHGLTYSEVTVWSTDGFFRETRDMVAYRREEGCSVVDMECAALASVAQKRGALFGQILFTADSLADTDRYDERGWGQDSFQRALTLCLDAVLKL